MPTGNIPQVPLQNPNPNHPQGEGQGTAQIQPEVIYPILVTHLGPDDSSTIPGLNPVRVLQGIQFPSISA